MGSMVYIFKISHRYEIITDIFNFFQVDDLFEKKLLNFKKLTINLKQFTSKKPTIMDLNFFQNVFQEKLRFIFY